MKDKIILLAKDDINNLPEYNGYIKTKLSKKYQVFFIGEGCVKSTLIKKEEYGVLCTFPKKKSRFLFYIQAFFLILKIKPKLIHVFWFPVAFIIPALIKASFNNFIVIGDFRTKSTFGGIKGRVKDFILRVESLFFYKRITIDRNLSQWLFKMEADCYIPMGYDESIFYDYKIPKKYDFVYAGSISKNRGICDFIKKFDYFTGHQYKFLILGWGDDSDTLIKLTNECDNLCFIGKVSRNEIAKFYSESKVGLNFVDKDILGIQQPTKILEYIACGNYLLTNDTDGVLELTKKMHFKGKVFSNLSELKGFNINSLSEFQGRDISEYSWSNIITQNLLPFYCRIIDENA